MKLGKLITGFILSTLLAVGVGVGIGSARNEIKGAEATTTRAPQAGDSIYYISMDNWSSANAYFFNDYSEGWPGTAMTKVGTLSGYNLFSIAVPTKNNKIPKQVIFNNGSSQTANLWITAAGNNAFWSNSGDDYLASIVCKITKKNLKDTSESSLGVEYISGTTWTAPKPAYVSGYEFDSWYKLDKTTKISGSLTGCDWETTVYAKYNSSSSHSGAIHIDLSETWSDAGANYAVLFMNKDTYATEVTSWSNYVTGTSAGTKLFDISYSLNFVPTLMLLARYNPSYSPSDWDANKWPTDGNAWGQTVDIAYSNIIRVTTQTRWEDNKNKNIAYTSYAKLCVWVKDAKEVELNSVRLKNGNVQYYSEYITLVVGSQFKVQTAPYTNSDYHASFTTHTMLASNFDGDQYNNITTLVAGTYSFYYDSGTGQIYITQAEIEWAEYFLTNVGCDPSGVGLPTGWDSCATEYSRLSDDAKDAVYETIANPSGTVVQKAVARYDVAVRNHSSLTRFIVNSSDTPRGTANNSAILSRISINSSNATIIVVVVSMIGVASLAGYYFFKKSRKTEE